MKFWLRLIGYDGAVEAMIYDAVEWRQTRRLSRAGDFSTRIPAGCETGIARKKILECWTVDGGIAAMVGSGVVDAIEYNDAGEAQEYTVSGGDMLRELTYRHVGKLQIGGYHTALNTGPQQIAQKFTPGWALAGAPNGYSTTLRPNYLLLNNESCLNALARLADLTGEYFICGIGRQVRWLRKDILASPFRAVQSRTPWVNHAADVALIARLTQATDTYEQATRIYPLGGSFSYTPEGLPTNSGVITLSDVFLEYTAGAYTLPTGYIMIYDEAIEQYYIVHPATEAAIGRIDKFVTWNDIKPAHDVGAHQILLSSTQLADVAVEWLQQHVNGQTTIDLDLVGAAGILLPGAGLSVEYRSGQIDTWGQIWTVIESETAIDQSGVRTERAQVVNYGRWPRTDGDAFADLANTVGYLLGEAGAVTGAQLTTTLETGTPTRLVEVRGVDGVPILRAEGNPEIGAESVIFGHPVGHRIEWDRDNGVRIAGSAIAPVLRASATWNPASMVNNGTTSTTVSLPGVVAGDLAIASLDQIGANNVIVTAVAGTDQVTIYLHNHTGGTLDIASGTVRVMVWTQS